MKTIDANRKRLTATAGVLAMALGIGWWQWRALASTKDTYSISIQQLDQMRADAAKIKSLGQSPRLAASRTKTNEELLAQIERGLIACSIDRARWQDSVPQPPVREPKSDYTRYTTRIYLERVTMQQLATVTYRLESDDPTLCVSALNLTARGNESSEFDAELGVTYSVYSPNTKERS